MIGPAQPLCESLEAICHWRNELGSSFEAQELRFDAFSQKRHWIPAPVLAGQRASDKHDRLSSADALCDPQSRFGTGHQNIAAVLEEAEHLGIPRVL
jgi:hypothetical protein